MTAAKTLCLNMIVKDEMANIERCLRALAPYISSWVIGDTGSTDGTQDFVKSFFAARGIPGELHEFPFVNFEQSRNAALDCAYASPLEYDYLLLCDADMELVVEDKDFRNKLAAANYSLLQRSGISYWNTRIVRRDPSARYRGVTHEYIDVKGEDVRLTGVWYKDNSSGSNRVDKFERDIRLLTAALESEPDNRRHQFYLAQSLRDAGRTAEAAQAYAKRAEMGGWEEEAWYARLQRARCLRTLKDESGFVSEALAAFNQRPQRAEPLYDLAKFYREKRMNDASALFAEAGMPLRRPESDDLFVEDFVYDFGLKEEYSIAANYARDPDRKDRGFAACDWLALSREAPERQRGLGRWNLFFYLKPASELLPSFQARPVEFAPPEGWRMSSPSVARSGEEILLLLSANRDSSDRRSFLLRLDAEFETRGAREVCEAASEARGFDDAFLFAWRDGLWRLASVRDPAADGAPIQTLARIYDWELESCRIVDARRLPDEQLSTHEGIWIPLVADAELKFIRSLDPTSVVDENGSALAQSTPAIAVEQFQGGSQAIAFDNGWLALVREASERDMQEFVQHRFVWLDTANRLRRVSRPFFFHPKRIERAAGLAWRPDGRRLVISFSVGDEAWLATVDASEVQRLLEDAGRPDSAPLEPALATSADDDRPTGRTFDLFDTLMARRCFDPFDIFVTVERQSGLVGFAEARLKVEAEIYEGAAAYTIDDIYARLADKLSVSAEQIDHLRAMELAAEKAELFPIAQHCSEFKPDEDAIVSDTYLPKEFLEAILVGTCNIRPRLFYLPAHGKRNVSVWRNLEQNMRIVEHVGDQPVTDLQSAEAAGVPVRLTTVARRTKIEQEFASSGLASLSNLIREGRLTTWANDPVARRAQTMQIEINFPLLFLATLQLRNLAVTRRWDNILMSGRDCYLWHRLYQKMAPLLPGAPPASYFYSSRVTRAHPSASYLAYFDRLRVGQRNVIVDLCGTGWSLSRLIEQAEGPETEVFLLHKIDMPHLTREYEKFGSLTGRIKIESVVARPPVAADNDVLEDLNCAPHDMVIDVEETNGGFAPVYSPVRVSENLAALIRIHHDAFERACELAAAMRVEDLAAMLDLATPAAIQAAYRRMAGQYGEFRAFLAQKEREEAIVWKSFARSDSR
jgi:glycosyltransferase involved in cell wall biosynthesis